MGSHAWAQTPASEASKPGHPATPAPTAPSPLQSPPKTEAQKIGGGAAPSPWARKPPQPIKALEVGDLRPVKKDELSPRIVAARREAEQELELPLIRRIPVITWVDPASVKRGQALTGRELDAFSDVPGTFVFTPSAGNVPPQGICTLSTQFIPSDSKRYELTTATVVLEVE